MSVKKQISATLFGLALCSASFALQTGGGVKANVILKTSTSWDGKPLVYPQGQAEITGMTVEIEPGAETGWHQHPVPSFGMITEGELEIRLKDGTTKTIKAGDTLAEVVNTLHTSRNTGNTPVKLLVFYAGAVGEKNTIKE